MTEEQRMLIEDELNFLDKRIDRAEEKMHQAEKDGNTQRAAHWDHAWDVHHAKLSGYIEVLNILGYSAVQSSSTDWEYRVLDS